MPYDVFYFLLTSSRSAPYGQIRLVSLMAPEMASADPAHVRLYAENGPAAMSPIMPLARRECA